jgi:hypothetical protein
VPVREPREELEMCLHEVVDRSWAMTVATCSGRSEALVGAEELEADLKEASKVVLLPDDLGRMSSPAPVSWG